MKNEVKKNTGKARKSKKAQHIEQPLADEKTPIQKAAEARDQERAPLPPPPSADQVREWLERDIRATIHVLDLIRLVPGLTKHIAQEIHAYAVKGPQIPEADAPPKMNVN